MTKLWLKYMDENGEEQRVPVESDSFTVGRHSASDLCILDSRLSREHILIERKNGSYVVTDQGSFNGTKLNGDEVLTPTDIRNGDILDLGGIAIEAEIGADASEANEPEAAKPEEAIAHEAAAASPPVQPAVAKKGGMPMIALLMIPMFGMVILLFAGVIIYVASTSGRSNQPNLVVIDEQDNNDEIDDDKPEKPVKQPEGPTGPGGPSGPAGPVDTPGGNISGPPPTVSPTAAVEESGAQFLRRIAQNDPRAFLTSEQAKRVDARVRQFKGSTALAENINSARKNAKTIEELAAATDVKPQLLAVAAIAKLGGGRGDVVATARAMSEVFGKLHPQIGSERSDDALLLMAAYDQGAAGETMKMRNMLQDLAGKYSVSPRELRSIWFLEKEGKITKSDFDRALTFLAVGAITQNPKAFGVNAEALTL